MSLPFLFVVFVNAIGLCKATLLRSSSLKPILKYSGFMRSREYCKCDQDIFLNVQDGTGDHGMLKLVGGTCVESHLQYGGSLMRPCQGILSFCLVDVSLSFGSACVCEWLDVSISCTSLFMGCCCNVNNFMCSVRWLGDPLFMGKGATASWYSRAPACSFFSGAQTHRVCTEAGWYATCLCSCLPRQYRIQAHMLVRMARAP